MKIDIKTWENAQDHECEEHAKNLRTEAYTPAALILADFMGMNLKEDFKDKTIVEVGSGPRGMLLLTEGNFKRGIVVEPLIDKWSSEIRETYEKLNIEIITEPYENAKLESVDETWFFNVLQHVIDPEEQLKKAKKQSKVIRVFEPIDHPTNIMHPHLLTKETFTKILGEFGQVYVGGSRSNFHQSNCYYGTWYASDNV